MIALLLLACAGKPVGTDTADTGATTSTEVVTSSPVDTASTDTDTPTTNTTSSTTGTTTGTTGTSGTTGTTATGTTGTTTGDPAPEGPVLADVVLEAPGADSGLFRDPELAVNGVRGGGPFMGSLDVYSIGLEPGDDLLVLGWSDRVVVDVPGPDLAVFENPFDTGPSSRFMDPAIVEVSPDGIDFVAFPVDYDAPDRTVWSSDPTHWRGFAGVTPVSLHAEDNPVDPFSLEAGGDVFDLADLPADDPTTVRIFMDGVRAVRVTAAAAQVDPETGAPWPRDPVSNGPDIDGIWAQAVIAD